jgi:hypothetical protein
MKTKWTQHLPTPEERKKFRDSVHNSKFVLDRLQEICYNSIEEAGKSSKDDYRLAAWPYYQADKLGYIRAIKEIIDLLQLDPEEK